MPFRRLLPVAALLLCAVLPLTFADQVVYFVNGKAIMVKSVEKGDKLTILEMEGGGKIGVPSDQIVKIEDYMITAPPASPVVPAQSALAPVPAAPIAAVAPGPVTAPPASALPAAPLMAPGPGMGGRPAGGLNDNLAHVQPLDIGGNNTGGPMQRPNPQGMNGLRSAGPGGPMLGAGPRANANMNAGRRFGRGFNPGGGRGNRLGMENAPPPVTPPQAAPAAAQPQATQPAPAPTPAPAVEPEAPPAPPDDSNNEEPSDPPPPDQADSSGNTPGSSS